MSDEVDVQKEAEELEAVLEQIKTIKEMPNEGNFYPVNRVARRNAAKRDRALKKRDKRG